MLVVPTRLHLVLACFGFAALATAETFELTEASIADRLPVAPVRKRDDLAFTKARHPRGT